MLCYVSCHQRLVLLVFLHHCSRCITKLCVMFGRQTLGLGDARCVIIYSCTAQRFRTMGQMSQYFLPHGTISHWMTLNRRSQGRQFPETTWCAVDKRSKISAYTLFGEPIGTHVLRFQILLHIWPISSTNGFTKFQTRAVPKPFQLKCCGFVLQLNLFGRI